MKNNIVIKPVKHYSNVFLAKSLIYLENSKKSGVYKWTNLITGKSYVGSSIDLTNRFRKYYSLVCLKKSLEIFESKIFESILNYGHLNFSLDILEYCKPNLLLKKEQYYMDLLNPEYNICKVAGSSLGRKHSLKTKQLISNSLKIYSINILRVKVMNLETNTFLFFPNNSEAGKYLGISARTLRKYKNESKIYLKKYIITNYKLN